MLPTNAPRFGVTECKSIFEQEFVQALHLRAETGDWHADAWPLDNRLMLSACPCDPDYNCVLRTLRIDFDGTAVWFGPDETHQFATDLDPNRPGVFVLRDRPITELAGAAADWLEQEIRRPIVRHEWDQLDSRGIAPRRWLLDDTGERLVARGLLPRNPGPPDRVVHVEWHA